MRLRRTIGFVVVCLAATVAGCASGPRWEYDTYAAGLDAARRDNQLLFVYLRHWAETNCTRFEESVLSRGPVIEATRDLCCVQLDFHWDQELATRWRVLRPPGVVILDSSERVLARLAGSISESQLLRAIERARRTAAGATPAAERTSRAEGDTPSRVR